MKRIKKRVRRYLKAFGLRIRITKPPTVPKMASALSDAVTMMRGYVGHAGHIERYHPLMQKVTDANQDYMQAVYARDERTRRLKLRKKRNSKPGR